jgi:hypothetical protein
MASNPGSWRRSLGLGDKEFSKIDVLKGIVAFVVQLFVMTSGALLINNQIELSKCNKDSNKSLNYFVGSILIIVASLMVLYSIFLMVKPRTVP